MEDRKNRPDWKVEDKGIALGAAQATPEKIEKAILSVIDSEGGARLESYVNTCVHCGLCAQACHWYLSHEDPHYAPVGKVKNTMAEMIKKRGKVSKEFMEQCVQIAHTECNLCRRCVQYCPFGIDTGYIMTMVRRVVHKLGMTPQYKQDTAHSHAATFNQMWVKDDEWPDSLQWQEDEARDEFPELRIPIDKDGADIMYSVIAPEPKFRTQLIYQAAALMNSAGADWTMPSEPGWDNSDMAMFSGDSEIMGRLKRRHFECASDLHVKRIVMGECGHAFRSVYDVGNRWVAWRDHPVEVVHAIAFYHELMTQGKLKLAKKFETPVTLHDPCNVVRGRGLQEKSRELAHYLCETVIEMEPNREHNLCCAAGGGVINCGPPFKNVRVQGNSAKAKQLEDAKARGAEIILAPCHNCHGGLEDIVHGYDLHMDIKFFIDIIYECMEKPEL